MRAYDFGPLWRSTIGYDRLLDLFDAAQRADGEDHYPRTTSSGSLKTAIRYRWRWLVSRQMKLR
jgi:hypothetical protein